VTEAWQFNLIGKSGRAARKNHCPEKRKTGRIRSVKYSEIIADNLSNAGWTWGCVSPSIPKDEQSGFPTLIAAMENVTLRERMKS
jgi:hypothetical protein